MIDFLRNVAVACGGLALLTTSAVAQQLPDPYVVPRGALRVTFEPSYANYDLLFDTNGEQFPLGRFFSADTLGASFLPTASPAEQAIRAITGDGAYRINAGAFTARQDADVRRFPFSFSLGLTNRLTFTAVVPIVTTRVHSATTLDTAGANAGWNQITSASGNATGLTDVAALLAELELAVVTVETEIAAGTYGCPSTLCDLAQDVSARAASMAADLQALTGVTSAGETSPNLPPFAPIATSAEGMAIADALAAISADLQTVGVSGIAGALPLPTGPVEGGAVNTVLTGTEFGYDARTLDPEDPVKLSRLGDIRVGLRYGVTQSPRFRLVLGMGASLPTGFRDLPDDYLDLGPGDRQLDLEWTLDAAIEPGSRLGVWIGAGYTLQLSDRLTRRIASVDMPLVVPTSAEVDRDLGDILRASVHPLLRLNDQFRVFLTAAYYRRGADRFTLGGQAVPELERFTEQETWSFGAGLWYRAETGRRTAALPIEAGIAYRSAFSGNGGATPKTSQLSLSLRLFYRLWGGPPAPPPAPDPAPPEVPESR